ncbi:MAG: hypothetical protein RMN25_07195 [Anaerolineae bacterium]|nr:hypothetical protein [Thermoflexales bacterium]MDW8407554.1 hypothetical protein [Anaerolineae bacterium]
MPDRLRGDGIHPRPTPGKAGLAVQTHCSDITPSVRRRAPFAV